MWAKATIFLSLEEWPVYIITAIMKSLYLAVIQIFAKVPVTKTKFVTSTKVKY